MAESPSLAKRVSLLAVNLVNPRFTNFNKPLCLAISVGILSLACFVPVLGYYMSQETTVITDESSEGTNLVSGPSFEIDSIFREYAKLPERCTLGGGSKWFQANGKNTSEDGLTTVEYSCDYHACIYSSYSLGGQWWPEDDASPDRFRNRYMVRQGAIEIDEDAMLDKVTWNMCRVQDEWAEGLVKNSNFIALYRETDSVANLINVPTCKAGKFSFVWCPLYEQAQALSWIKQCCTDMQRNSALSTACQQKSSMNITTFNNTWCHDILLEMSDYVVALNTQTRPSMYPVCPDQLLRGFSGEMGDCPIADNGAWDPLSFKIHWTRKEIKTTRTRPSPLTALSSALALTTYIEMAVTLVVVVILRQCGCVKEIKKFTWGELMNEQRDPEVEQKEMEERMQANIIVNMESNRDSVMREREPMKCQENHLLGKATE